jgi:CBS domain-containing protein
MKALALRHTDVTELPIPGADPWYVQPDDPALSVMTDFRSTASITVSQSAPIDEALEHMRHTGVRCAFAIDESRRTVVGMVTAYDIMGEQPMRQMQAASMPRREVLVWHLMRRTPDWTFLHYEDVARATVVEIERLFDELGLTHLPVMSADEDGSRRLRGLLSAAKVRRLLRR